MLPHYQVKTAENGQVALDYLKVIPKPNLIISDIMMPLMDGYQLLQTLKTSEQYRFLPVIMLTALAQADHKLKALRIGVDDYMLKPFSEEELIARVHNLIKHAFLRQQFLQKEENLAPTVNETGTEKEATSIKLSETDQAWLAQLEIVSLRNLSDFNCSVEQLASEMAQSRWQFNRQLKGLTGLTGRQYLLETFDFTQQNGISKQQLSQLRELLWLEQQYNLILMGPSGVGKTFMAAGLAYDAIKTGYDALFRTMQEVVDVLKMKDMARSAKAEYQRMLKSQLLVIDDMMMFPVDKKDANRLFHLINHLHEKSSIIITTNKSPKQWAEVLNDAVLATAMLDRILYRCEIIQLQGKSYRMANRQTIFENNPPLSN